MTYNFKTDATPTVAQLAEIVLQSTRAAFAATQRQDLVTMRAELAKVSGAMHSALCYGLREQVAAELEARGFGADGDDPGSALAEAKNLGAEIYCGDGIKLGAAARALGRWYWRYGTHCRSSNDHYGRSFATAGEAAAHFLGSREGIRAKEYRARLPQAHRARA